MGKSTNKALAAKHHKPKDHHRPKNAQLSPQKAEGASTHEDQDAMLPDTVDLVPSDLNPAAPEFKPPSEGGTTVLHPNAPPFQPAATASPDLVQPNISDQKPHAARDRFMHTVENNKDAANGHDAAENGSPVTSFGSAGSQIDDSGTQYTAESAPASEYSSPHNGGLHAEANGKHAAEEIAGAEEQGWPSCEPQTDQTMDAQSEETSATDAAASVELPDRKGLPKGFGEMMEDLRKDIMDVRKDIDAVEKERAPLLVSLQLHLCSGVQAVAPKAVRGVLDCAVSAFVEAVAACTAIVKFSFGKC